MKTSLFLRFSIITSIWILSTLFLQNCKPDKDKDTVVYKPNIYIYPVEKTDILINLFFPEGGNIIESIPAYGQGWNVSVDTNGLINNIYPYLFYESVQPDIWQHKLGWKIPYNELKPFFEKNMKEYGFSSNEINDFVEYWIPRLEGDDFYFIYPQTSDLINQVITINFSKQPDNLLRLFYYIIPGNEKTQAPVKPEIRSFNREGFVVAEWGVIL